jgi:hypothetical protein
MRTYTNLAWPEDPYRTGQQLYRRPVPRLAAFSLTPPPHGNHPCATAVAIVYLPLHRSRTLAITTQTVAFGFHAASTGDPAKADALALAADLDLLQACRHAAVLAGHLLADDLSALRALAPGTALRGVTAVGQAWADRRSATRGRATTVDCGLDLPATTSLAELCAHALVSASAACTTVEESADDELAAVRAVERALVIALAAARHLDRYTWEGALPVDEIMAIGAWDCFPHLGAHRPERVGGAATLTGCPPHGDSAQRGQDDRQQ